MIPLLVFLVLLTNKLDESIRISFFSASTPLFLTFVTLIMASFGARGGKVIFHEWQFFKISAFLQYQKMLLWPVECTWIEIQTFQLSSFIAKLSKVSFFFQAINTGSASESHPANSCSGFALAFSFSETSRTAFTRTDSHHGRRHRCRSRRRRRRPTSPSSTTTTARRSLRKKTRCWSCPRWP